MLSKESPACFDTKGVRSLAGFNDREPTGTSLRTVDCDVNGLNFAHRKGRSRFSRKSLDYTKARRLAGSQGSLNGRNLKYSLLFDWNGGKNCLPTGNLLMAHLDSVRYEGAISRDIDDGRGVHSILNDINDFGRDTLRALVDNEKSMEATGNIRRADPNSQTLGQVSISLVTATEKELESSTPIAQNDANYFELCRRKGREGSTRGSEGLKGSVGDKSIMKNRSRFGEFLPGLLPALERADTLNKINRILQPALELSSSDLALLLRAVKPPERVAELFFWMREKGKIITDFNIYKEVLRVLSKRQEWLMIDNLLRETVWSFQDEGGCEVFNILFKACLIAGSSDWATEWFRLMVEQGIHPSRATYSLLFSLYQRLRKLQEAEFLYQHMEKSACKFPEAYLAMINLYTVGCQFDKVERIFIKMREENVKSEKNVLFWQLDAYVRQGRVNEAEAVMEQMQESGIMPNIFAYNSMITVNGKANRFEEARDWFLRLEQEGLQPNEKTYRSLIGACGRSGRFKEALKFYDQMRLSGFLPNINNFNTLIHLHRKVGNDSRILCLLTDMRQMGCCPDSSTLDALVKVYERYGELEKIPQALKLLEEAGWLPDEKSYGILLRAYVRCSLVEPALDAFNHLQARARVGETLCHNLICLCKMTGEYEGAIHVFLEMQQGGSQPSLITSCTMIEIYGLKGAIKEGAALFELLRSTGQELDSMAYNAIINMYLNCGLVQKALEILNLVNEHKGLQPDSNLFLSMLTVCARLNMHQECANLYWRMIKSKLVWTEALYNGVIHYCGRALPLEEIAKVFHAAMYANISIDNTTCNVMIDVFGQTGLLEKAEKVFIIARRHGMLDCISFNNLIRAYGKFQEFSKMEAVLTEMERDGIKDRVEAYNSMLDAYGKYGQISKMDEILKLMRQAGCNAT